MPPSIDMTNAKFDKLTVLKKDDTQTAKTLGAYWICQCECGGLRIVQRILLTGGRIKSCKACARQGPHNKREKKTATGSLNTLISNYINGANRRNLKWSLTDDEAALLFQESCHYCGLSPSQTINSMRGGRSRPDTYLHGGIDRKDPKLGYSKENCVPCCKTCNHAKAIMTYEEFINYINRLKSFERLY